MKKRLISIIMAAVLASSVFLTVSAAETTPSEKSGDNTVTIYTTNDIHGVVAQSNTAIGMAQAAGIAASTENSLLVDAGDATQGASFATITQGQDVIRMMNSAGYNVMAAGNHEFDYGTEQLMKNVGLADFPVLSANVLLNGAPMLEKNTIISVGNHKIGFIGLTTTATATSTNPSQLKGVEFEDELKTAKEQIAELSGKTDAIVLICHMGNNETAVGCTSGALLEGLSSEELSKVTAVVDGHSHTLEDGTYGDTSIPVIQTGTAFTALGEITLTFDDNGVYASGDVMDYNEAMNFSLTADGEAKKQEVLNTLAEIQNEQNSVLEENLCINNTPLWGGYIYYDYAEPRIVETNYGDFVTDAFASYAREFAERQGLDLPVIAVENGGGISATLPYGQVKRGDVLNAFNHGNMVDVLRITPAQLYAAVESGLSVTGQDETGLLIRERVSGSFLQASGFSYTYDPSRKSGEKVTNITLDGGKAVSRNDTNTQILLATNNYVSSFAAFANSEKLGELGGEDLIVENYILEQTQNGNIPLSVPTNGERIMIANDCSPDTYEVKIPIADVTSKEDEENADTLSGKLVHIRVDNGEYNEYVIGADKTISLTLDKGPHTICLKEANDSRPVYVNNYSGSGTVTTSEGYYKFGFDVDPANIKPVPESEPETSVAPQESVPESTGLNPGTGDSAKPNTTTPNMGEATPSAPNTGDKATLSLFAMLIIVSFGSFAAFKFFKEKQR